MELSKAELAHAADYMMKTPQGVRPNQACAWHGRAPAPNAYMSPSDFRLSPMSQRLLRGSRKQRVLVSATAMNLPADPGFLVEKEVDEPFMEEKENGFVPVMPVHKRTEKTRGLSTLNSNAAPMPAPMMKVKNQVRRIARKGLSESSFSANQTRLVR